MGGEERGRESEERLMAEGEAERGGAQREMEMEEEVRGSWRGRGRIGV